MGYEKLPTSPSSSTNDSRRTSEETARPEEEHLMGYPKYESSSKSHQSRLLGSCWWLLTVAILLILNIMTLVLLFQSVRRVRSLETPPPKSWLPPEGEHTFRASSIFGKKAMLMTTPPPPSGYQESLPLRRRIRPGALGRIKQSMVQPDAKSVSNPNPSSKKPR